MSGDLELAGRFEAWFKDFSSWGLSRDELLRCLLKPGNGPGDTIYTSPRGSEMTRHMGTRWLDFYDAASAGWNAATRLEGLRDGVLEEAALCADNHKYNPADREEAIAVATVEVVAAAIRALKSTHTEDATLEALQFAGGPK